MQKCATLIFILLFNFILSQESGKATFYHDKYNGRLTKSEEIFSNKKFTAASNIHPMGTIVKVTNQANGKSTTVKINDTGPFKFPRIIDLSKAAFESIADLNKGIITVLVEVVK